MLCHFMIPRVNDDDLLQIRIPNVVRSELGDNKDNIV